MEIVNIRLRARGIPEKPRFLKQKDRSEQPPKEAILEERKVVFDREPALTRIMARERLLSGNRIKGPAIVVEYSSTIVIPPFADARVDGYGNIIMEIMA